MKYFKKELGDNKEKLWAAVLKIFQDKKIKPKRFSNFIIEKAKSELNNS